ncbi:MAG: 4-alpha-glucanotransferase [Desulfovibrio sp.]|nr:MAG: 4-alpha-glucanotransferase [Desulfovibrio sp.]
MNIRGSGILLHMTSLPSRYGIGDLGPSAYAFADVLSQASQSYWQILPLGPTSPAIGNSPYSSFSAFAGNPLLIHLEELADAGLLAQEDLVCDHNDERKVRYPEVESFKLSRLETAYARWREKQTWRGEYDVFCRENQHWLDDFALFMALKDHFGGQVWSEWPVKYRDRDHGALREFVAQAETKLEQAKFIQFLFFRQWAALKRHCTQRKVHIIGDMPIYVTYDSSDVWVNSRLFKLDEDKEPTFVAGVPPDYFSETGQRWGNPVYNWDVLRQERYGWWVERMEHNLRLFDYIRLDHFRGFAAYWEVPAEEETAINGTWVDVPGMEFFATLYRHISSLPIIAEDLGVITADVRELRDHFGFPGMKILQFGFGWNVATDLNAPHSYTRNSVVYSGTHDNTTVKGWFDSEASVEDRERFLRYVGADNSEEIHWKFLRLAMMSTANTAIFPMQDVLGLGGDTRMNTPSVGEGNWEWRLLEDEMEGGNFSRLAEMTRFYGRA